MRWVQTIALRTLGWSFTVHEKYNLYYFVIISLKYESYEPEHKSEEY